MTDLIERAKAALDGYSKTTIDHDQWLSFTRALIDTAAERDAAIAELVQGLRSVAQSTGCCDVCPCHMKATRKARALIAKYEERTNG